MSHGLILTDTCCSGQQEFPNTYTSEVPPEVLCSEVPPEVLCSVGRQAGPRCLINSTAVVNGELRIETQ